MQFFPKKKVQRIMGECRECGLVLTPPDWKEVKSLVCPQCGHENDIIGLREEYELKAAEKKAAIGVYWYEDQEDFVQT